MTLTELPYGLPGKIFRSPMPFGYFDHDNHVFEEFEQQGISTVVMLTSDEEALKRSGLDLRAFYRDEGLRVIHVPIEDFGVPDDVSCLEPALQAALDAARNGDNLAIHCYAGLGRTGLFAALLARRVLSLSGEEAIKWVRSHIPGSIETGDQVQLILDYDF